MTVSDSTATAEDDLKAFIGQPTGLATVLIERGPVANFAEAVLDDSPVYRTPEAAREAGFDNIPAPITFPFVMETWGKFAEIQPDGATENRLMKVMGPLMAKGGLILHGEQEFIYHRPIVVGDVLHGEGKITEAYQKESKGRTMTFIVTETDWADEAGNPVVTARFNLIHRA